MNVPRRPKPMHPLLEAVLGRVAVGAARAGARANEALKEAVAEEADQMLEQLADKAVDISQRFKDARARRRGQ